MNKNFLTQQEKGSRQIGNIAQLAQRQYLKFINKSHQPRESTSPAIFDVRKNISSNCLKIVTYVLVI